MTSVRTQLACIATLGFTRLWMVKESSYSTPERQRALNVYTQAVIRTGDWVDCAAATPRLKRYLQDQTKPRVSSQERCSISRDVYRSLLVGGPNCEKLATLLIHVHQKKIPLHLNAKTQPVVPHQRLAVCYDQSHTSASILRRAWIPPAWLSQRIIKWVQKLPVMSKFFIFVSWGAA